ncbi:hypothetical protein CEQ90_16330 [Lewinellaceae bacterium SD302]|nr:hypothetical protein CEQ90_16330 [Lewinellaceae bacterium SD302]
MRTLTTFLFFLAALNFIAGQSFRTTLVSPATVSRQTSNSDLNGDGHQDLITVNGEVGWLKWVVGAHAYPEYRKITPDENYTHALTGDVDSDGDIDIVALGDDRVVLLKNNDGEAGFWLESMIDDEEVNDPDWGALGDIDGDGDLDLLVASRYGYYLGWYENTDGTGEFQFYAELPDAQNARSFGALVDFDQDGDLDVLSAGCYLDCTLEWYENLDGEGEFGIRKEIYFDDYGIENMVIDVGDVDGDGYEDIMTTSTYYKVIRWHRNLIGSGEMGFAAAVDISDFDWARSIELTDLDNDNDLDIAVAGDDDTHLIGWYENWSGDGLFSNLNIIDDETDVDYSRLICFDIDENGTQDILTAGTLNSHTIGWYANEENTGSFGRVNELVHPYIADEIMLNDVDGDGNTDIVAGGSWYTNSGYDYLAFSNIRMVDEEGHLSLVEDFTNDGITDLITLERLPLSTHKKIVLYERSGEQFIFSSDIVEVDNASIKNLVSLDYDNDGDLDFVYQTAYDVVWLCENLGSDNGFAAPVEIADTEVSVNNFELGDLDGDGYVDILIGTDWNQRMGWYRNEAGSGTFSDLAIISSGQPYEQLDWDDQDGDGDLDLVYVYEENILRRNNEGNGVFSSEEVVYHDPAGGHSFRRIYCNDHNDDGLRDFLFFDQSSYGWRFLTAEIEGGYLLSAEAEFIPSNNVEPIKFYDLDNDGDDDMLFAQGDKLYVSENLNSGKVLQGLIYYDENENGINDDSDSPLVDQLVSIDPTQLFLHSNTDGLFSTVLGNGQYEVRCDPEDGWGFVGDSIVNIQTSSDADTIWVEFPLINTDTTSRPSVEVTSGPVRCGFEVPFWLTVNNDGYVPETGDFYFYLDSLVALAIDPADHPNLFVDAEGRTGLFWEQIDISPGARWQTQVLLQMPSVDFIGEALGFNGIFEYAVGINELQSNGEYTRVLNCSYDPNDKSVEENLPGYPGYSMVGDSLEYLIRFQNLGSDTAINIKVSDQLSEHFDRSKLRILSASHNYRMVLTDDNRLNVYFDNIYLPDAMTDEAGSHGFIKFRVGMLPGSTDGDVIENQADIYFDFNPPITTNVVYNTILERLIYPAQILAPKCFEFSDGSISVEEVVNGVDYFWNGISSSNHIENLSAGTNTLEVYRSDGKILADTSYQITDPDILEVTAEIEPASFANSGSIIATPTGGTAPYTYVWQQFPEQQGNEIGDLAAGNYDLQVIDANGCIIDAVFIVPEVVSTAEHLAKSPLSLRIYPNPARALEFVNIRFSEVKNESELLVYDNLKRIVVRRSIAPGSYELTDLKLAPGNYFLVLISGGKHALGRLVIIGS